MELLDQRATVERFLDELFPFHLIVRFGPPPRIIGAGPSLERWLDREFIDAELSQYFTIARPAISDFDAETITGHPSAVFVLNATAQDKRLRGQFTILDDRTAAFVGSPVITADDGMDSLGLAMNDFAPHDSTPNLLILQRFTEMQLNDILVQKTTAEEALKDRDRIRQKAAVDPLTFVASRSAFLDHCREALSPGDGPPGITLLFIDVDDFNTVNDRLGHHRGDIVLRDIAARLQSAVRPSDLVARIGGDEFAIILVHQVDPVEAEIVERIRASFDEPFHHDDGPIHLSVSVGAAIATRDDSTDALLRNANLAMYEGRREGHGRVTWFAEPMRSELEHRRRLTNDLEAALAMGALHPAFQPIVRLDDRRLVSCEALARWNHPTEGPVGPDSFVPLAEQAGLVDKLDHLMLQQSLDAVAEWQRDLPDLGLQVNFSGRSIGSDLATKVAETMAAAGVAPSTLTLEVTESWFVHDEAEVAQVLGQIADLGVSVHLDDFGTGYSSLTHLHAFPITGLKIDRSFVTGAVQSERSRRLIAAMISLAHSLDLEVIAEGVETESEAQLLTDLGCDFGQGYLFSRPATRTEFSALVDRAAPAGVAGAEDRTRHH